MGDWLREGTAGPSRSLEGQVPMFQWGLKVEKGGVLVGLSKSETWDSLRVSKVRGGDCAGKRNLYKKITCFTLSRSNAVRWELLQAAFQSERQMVSGCRHGVRKRD